MTSREASAMFCNCRFRKPVMLLIIVSLITFINYSFISWIFGDKKPNDGNGGAAASELRFDSAEKTCPIFPEQVQPSSTQLHNKIVTKEIEAPSEPRGNSFFDAQAIKEMMQEEELQMVKLEEEAPIRASSMFRKPSEKPVVNMDEMIRMNSRETKTGPDLIRKNTREPSMALNPKLNGRPDVWDVEEEIEVEDEDEKPGKNIYGSFVSQRMPNGKIRKYDPAGVFSSDEEEPEQMFFLNVTEKVKMDIPESQFAGATFEEGKKLVRGMMDHAWKGYRRHAWGMDDLRPWTNSSQNGLGDSPLGLTIVDSLDTLYLMGMKKEFEEAADWVFESLDFDKTPNLVSLFETNIRLLGGLLSAYALTRDKRFLEKATDLGDRFMRNFHDDDPYPSNNLQLKNFPEEDLKGAGKWQKRFARIRSVSLAQIGTFSVEFGFLSHVTGNPIYRDRAVKIVEALEQLETGIPGLFPSTITPYTMKQSFEIFSLGGDADSFYEYLLKYWLLTGKKDKLHKRMYNKAMEAFKEHLIVTKDGRKFITTSSFGENSMQMDHLACFAPGMFGLGAVNDGDDELLKLAEELTESCYLTYHMQGTT